MVACVITTRASYQIRKIVGCACAGIPGTFSHHWFQRKSPVSYPSMHHGTCVTHSRRMHNPQFYVYGKRHMEYFLYGFFPWNLNGITMHTRNLSRNITISMSNCKLLSKCHSLTHKYLTWQQPDRGWDYSIGSGILYIDCIHLKDLDYNFFICQFC